jgi:hypothetical protein
MKKIFYIFGYKLKIQFKVVKLPTDKELNELLEFLEDNFKL